MNLGKLKSTLKLGSHYKIERFGISFGLLSLALIAVLGIGLSQKMEKDKATMVEKVIYTEKFVTSRTNLEGEVYDVFINKDKTRAFLMLKFEEISKISANAKDYQMFMTPAKTVGNNLTWKSRPAGSIYMFGSTGYMGVYLVNEKGFDSQILQLTIRANAEMVPVTAAVKDETGDISFEKYDQFRVFFNPGASHAKEVKSLSDDQLDVTKVFEELVLTAEENKVKESLTKRVEELRVTLNAIGEYTRRSQDVNIDGQRLIVPSATKDIVGDKVESKDGVLYFRPQYVYPGGYDFDWQNGSVKAGYSKLVTKDGLSLFETIRAKKTERDDITDTNVTRLNWALSNGVDFMKLVEEQGNLTIVKEAHTNVSSLINAWSYYQNAKRNYQTKELLKLLDLELTLENVRTNYTINTNENVLKLY